MRLQLFRVKEADGGVLTFRTLGWFPLVLFREVGYPESEIQSEIDCQEAMFRKEIQSWLRRNPACTLLEVRCTAVSNGVELEADVHDSDAARVKRLVKLIMKPE